MATIRSIDFSMATPTRASGPTPTLRRRRARAFARRLRSPSSGSSALPDEIARPAQRLALDPGGDAVDRERRWPYVPPAASASALRNGERIGRRNRREGSAATRRGAFRGVGERGPSGLEQIGRVLVLDGQSLAVVGHGPERSNCARAVDRDRLRRDAAREGNARGALRNRTTGAPVHPHELPLRWSRTSCRRAASVRQHVGGQAPDQRSRDSPGASRGEKFSRPR